MDGGGRVCQAGYCRRCSVLQRAANTGKKIIGRGKGKPVMFLRCLVFPFFTTFFFCPSSCVGVVGIGVDVIECIQVYCKIDSSVV